MPVVTLTIDDKPISAAAGETVLAAARAAGVAIPTLCHLDGASDVGACRMCLVEIEGAHTWDVAGRGRNARVITDMAQPWGEAATCTSCGKCVQACPTGALFRQGSTVAEMAHDRQKLAFLTTAREKKQWVF